MTMSGELFMFLLFSLFAIGGAVFMLSFTKVVHMVVAIACTFLSLGGLYVMLGAEFIAFVQILIYAGAISILMIFGIMMTKHQEEGKQPVRKLHNTFLVIGVLSLFAILFFSIQRSVFPPSALEPVEDNTRSIGELIYSLHVIPFELVSVLLTVAFIGAIILAKREEGDRD